MVTMRSALVVDDEPLVAALIKDTLSSVGFDVAVALNATEAIDTLRCGDLDVAIIDISLGRGPSGIDVAHLAHSCSPGTALLLLSRYPDLRTARVSQDDLPAGCGFLCKDTVADAGVLVEAVERVLREEALDATVDTGPLASLTRQQLIVLHLVAQGFTTAEIARRRQRSVSAVEKMLGTIYLQLGIHADTTIHPRVEAIRIYAAAAGLPERAS